MESKYSYQLERRNVIWKSKYLINIEWKKAHWVTKPN